MPQQYHRDAVEHLREYFEDSAVEARHQGDDSIEIRIPSNVVVTNDIGLFTYLYDELGLVVTSVGSNSACTSLYLDHVSRWTGDD